MKKFLTGILMFLSFDTVHVFPSKYCKAKSKYLLFYTDCRDEIEAQGDLVERIDTYFRSLSRTNMVFTQQFTIKTNGDYENFSPLDRCKQSLPVDQLMTQSRRYTDKNNSIFFTHCTAFRVAFIFISSISDSELASFNKTIADERDRNDEVPRYFIITTSKNTTSDFIFAATSFDDVLVDDLIPKMCDMKREDVSFTYSGGKYFDTKYFIATHKVSTTSGKEAECYCDETRGIDLLSVETYGEGFFISQALNSSSMSDVNVILTLGRFKRERYRSHLKLVDSPLYNYHPYVGDFNDCYYINMSSFTKNCLGKPNCNLVSFKEKVACNQSLVNSLIVCEYNDVPNFQSNPSHNLFKVYNDINVFNRKSLHDFTNMLSLTFEADPNAVGNWEISHHQCIMNKTSIHYMCDYNALSNSNNNEEETAMPPFINILSTDRHSIFKLKQLDISKCSNYNDCQQKTENETLRLHSSADVIFYCFEEVEDEKNSNGTCSPQVVHLNLSLENFQCESDQSKTFPKCIKNDGNQCEDSSNLFHCENFTCPEPFFKCSDSYCIFPFQISDETYDCSLGEDDPWAIDQYRLQINMSTVKKLRFKFVLRDICLDSLSQTFLYKLTNERSYICDTVCPNDFQCISSRRLNQDQDRTDADTIVNIYSVEMDFLNVFNSIYPQYNFFKYFPLISIVQLEANIFTHGLSNFDEGFRHWDFDELVVLDLSRNGYLIHSDKFSSVTRFSKLKYLNLSYNYNLTIDPTFSFPSSLETIDLSFTKMRALSKCIFQNLTSLRHLNLSYTLMTKFEDLGIPSFYSLDTFYIKGVLFNYLLEPDFFRGLTIRQELQTSYYVLCCPVILSHNISVDMCHAPSEFISSCTHLVGDTLKRIVVWVVGILTVVGNGIVLVYRIGWNREMFKKAYGLFISGLAVSDFIMGIYLLSIACVDTYYEEVYDLKDYRWRNGLLCHLLGFLSTLSSETSTFFICLITADRFLSITYPFGEHRFSKTGKTLSYALVWLVGIVVAILPVVLSDWEIYSSNGLCLALPFSSKQYKGWIFSFIVFVVLNFALFLLIAVGQLAIFLNLLNIKKTISIVNSNSQGRSDEWSVAKKLAYVALTDFCCWFPVGILGMLSLQGYIFNREVYAWIAVFVLPINSALNPIIYTIPALYNLCKGKVHNIFGQYPCTSCVDMK